MSKWVGCPCGVAQSDVGYPAANRAYLLSESDLDAITRYGFPAFAGEWEDLDVISADDLEERAFDVWTCWNCGRLLIFGKGGLTVYEKVVDKESTKG